jgi:CRP-like cAMP-binding protein
MRPVRLVQRQTLYDMNSVISHCYFVQDALISMMSFMEPGASVAVGMVGCEGLVGAAALLDEHLLPYRVVTQTPGTALRVRATRLKEALQNHDLLRKRIMKYAHAMFTQVVQTAACNRFHGTDQRLTRWLLLAHDRLSMDTLPFTQEALSQVLGTDRVSVTRAAQKLKEAGLLAYSRGKTTILDYDNLASVTCECYGIIKTAYDDLTNMCRPGLL